MKEKTRFYLIFFFFFLPWLILTASMHCSLFRTVEVLDTQGRVTTLETRLADSFALLNKEEFLYVEDSPLIKEHRWYEYRNEKLLISKKEKFAYWNQQPKVHQWRSYKRNDSNGYLELQEMWEYDYDPAGKRISAAYYSGSSRVLIKKMQVTLNENDQIMAVSFSRGSNLESLTEYLYNEKGQIQQILIFDYVQNKGRRTNYIYDEKHRLIEITVGSERYVYEYDQRFPDQDKLMNFHYYFDHRIYETANRIYTTDGAYQFLNHTIWMEDGNIKEDRKTYFKRGTPYQQDYKYSSFVINKDGEVEWQTYEQSLTNPTEIALTLTLESYSVMGPEPEIPIVENPLLLEEWYPFTFLE